MPILLRVCQQPRVNQKFEEFFKRIQRLVNPSSLPPEEKQEKKEDCKDSGTEKDKNKVFRWNDQTKRCTRSCAPGYEKSSKPRGYCVKPNDILHKRWATRRTISV